MSEGWPTIETDAGEAEDGEVHGQHIASLASRIIARRAVNYADMAIRECRGIEGRRRFGIALIPEAKNGLGHVSHSFRFHCHATINWIIATKMMNAGKAIRLHPVFAAVSNRIGLLN